MACAIRDSIIPRGKGVRVNGIAVARDAIAREIQHHRAETPAAAWAAAAQALVVRELLLQEARRLGIVGEPRADAAGRRETDDEAAIRTLIAHEVKTPEPDEASCRRYYEQNHDRFRSADIFEAAHILIAASRRDAAAYERARAAASEIAAALRKDITRFPELARAHSDCPSAAQGGNLGQITPGQTTPEFEWALRALTIGAVSDPVATRYGFHVIRLDRRIDGRLLPFETVADRIAEYLHERVARIAVAQYIARLASRAAIEGVALPDPEALRVH